ncbi:MAG: hypothetical protein MUD08_08280 [Cytophagales bacterium]|nr:hypothetical protein [Cytophagales bacterium]
MLAANWPLVGLARRPFRPRFDAWASRSYKSLTVCLLAASTLILCYLQTGADILSIVSDAVLAGAVSVVASILISPEWNRKSVLTTGNASFTGWQLMPSQTFSRAGSLIIGLAALLFVFFNQNSHFLWTIYPTLSLLGGFALGGSAVMMLVMALQGDSRNQAKNVTTQQFIPERFDVLAGTIVAGVLLGTTLVEANALNLSDVSQAAGIVWLPAVLAFCGICVSLAMRRLLRDLDLPPAIKRILGVFAMLVVAYVLVVTLLPAYWVIEGQENLSSEVFLAAGMGSIGGLLLLEAGHAYHWLRTRYYQWVFAKAVPSEAWYLRPLRHTFRVVCLTIPVVLVAWFLHHAFEEVGLYGIIVSAVALLSNLNAQLTFGKKVFF